MYALATTLAVSHTCSTVQPSIGTKGLRQRGVGGEGGKRASAADVFQLASPILPLHTAPPSNLSMALTRVQAAPLSCLRHSIKVRLEVS